MRKLLTILIELLLAWLQEIQLMEEESRIKKILQ